MTSTETTTNPNAEQIVELAPSYLIPIFLILTAIALSLVNLVVAAIVGILGLFLLFQSVNIKLQFTPTALDVYSFQKMIRSFPYDEWTNWRIFWRPIPILFYFREVNSIHFLPIIFDPKTLVACLEKYCPKV